MFKVHRDPRPFLTARLSNWPDFYVQKIIVPEHRGLRWSVFTMHWSIIGWCASYDASDDYVHRWFGKPTAFKHHSGITTTGRI